MATGSGTLYSLQCSICHERYKQPKVLDCLHSFCQNCLEEYYRGRYQGAPKIPCPLCRQETVLPEGEVKGLKTNFHLSGLVEEITLHEKVKKTPEEDGSKCQKHKGEVARFYCESCDKLICRDCTVVDHQQHHYSDSGEASRKHRQSLKDAFTSFNEDINALETSLAAASQGKQDFTKKITKTMEEVQANAAIIRAEVTIQEKKIIDEIKRLQQDQNKTFDEHEKTVSMLLQRKQHSLETAKDVTNTASDSNFLSLYPTIRDDLKSLSSQHPPKFDSKLLHVRFIQGQGIRGINLGELEVETSKWTLYDAFGISYTQEGEFMFAWVIATSQSGDSEIVVAHARDWQVVICGTEGHCSKGIIPLQEYAVGIASVHNRLVVVDRTKYVKMFNEEGKQALQFLTVPQREDGVTSVCPESVAVTKDCTIIVGDVKRNVLTEHKTTGALIRTIPVNTEPYFLAVDSCNDRVVISDMKQVDIADTKGEVGETLFTIKPTIDGQPGDCNGVCCDNSGIYIAVSSTMGSSGHIHHYDADGEFLGCLSQCLNNAWGITITPDGKLAVTDLFSIKVYHKV